jgi:hypothetical protein
MQIINHKATRVVTSSLLEVKEGLPRPCANIQGAGKVGECHATSNHHVVSMWQAKPHHLHQTLTHVVIIKPSIQGVQCNVQGGEGMHLISACYLNRTKCNASIKWLGKVSVHCPKYGLPAHKCAIITISTNIKPICPSSKVQKM